MSVAAPAATDTGTSSRTRSIRHSASAPSLQKYVVTSAVRVPESDPNVIGITTGKVGSTTTRSPSGPGPTTPSVPVHDTENGAVSLNLKSPGSVTSSVTVPSPGPTAVSGSVSVVMPPSSSALGNRSIPNSTIVFADPVTGSTRRITWLLVSAT